jgi:hypothetical protein
MLGCSRAERPRKERAQALIATDTLALHSMNESDIDGEAMLSWMGDTLRVKLELEHLTPGDDYPAYIYAGRCDVQGPKLAALESVLASAGGTGRSTTRVPMAGLTGAPAEQRHEGLFLQVLHPNDRAAACVDLPSRNGPTT